VIDDIASKGLTKKWKGDLKGAESDYFFKRRHAYSNILVFRTEINKYSNTDNKNLMIRSEKTLVVFLIEIRSKRRNVRKW